jgi:hypothetical protein
MLGAVGPPGDVQSLLRSDRLQELNGYWLARRGTRRMPARCDIEPADIKRVLPLLFLADVVPGLPAGYRYRLVGTHVTDVLGVNATGLSPGEVFGEEGIGVREVYDSVVATGLAYVNRRRLDWYHRDYAAYELLILPLGADDGPVNMLLGALDFEVEVA